jgi:hypothetical protein
MKYSVLTYIIGNYENIHEINFDISDSEVEYICVTDRKDLTSNTWKVVYDEELDNPNLEPFEKVFRVRYNLFKYVKNDICLRIDGSIGINKPLDSIIETFENGNYDACLNLHIGRNNIIDEYNAWMTFRNFPHNDAIKHINFIKNVIEYDLNKRCLIEQNFSINRRNEWTNKIDRDMLSILRELNNGQCTRLDQTLFTAYMTKNYPDKKYLFVDDFELFNKHLTWFVHGTNQPIHVGNRGNTVFYFNDKPVETLKIK